MRHTAVSHRQSRRALRILLISFICAVAFTISAHALELPDAVSAVLGSRAPDTVSELPGEYIKLIAQGMNPRQYKPASNQHPVNIDANDLAVILASLHASEPVSAPVFSSMAAGVLAPKLAAALARADAREDVIFAFTDKGDGRRTVTSARMFYLDDKLHFIFGDTLQSVDAVADSLPNQFREPFRAGKRSERIRDHVRVDGPGVSHWPTRISERDDWIIVDIPRIVVAYQGPTIALVPFNVDGQIVSTRTTQSAPPVEERVTPLVARTADAQELQPAPDAAEVNASRPGFEGIRRRLAELKQLFEEGLITDEDYTLRRREILDEI
ncbi:MAG: SHOCT domain-containing protein [Gammaproteobacteria bacterium]|nr:SHOCT domain-containing protein [Gammaproteobacteria bacterium]